MNDRERRALRMMRDYARQAIAWSKEAGSGWVDDPKTVAAVAHAVGQIGEAARRISTATRTADPGIAWAAIAAMRNRIYHEYGNLDATVLRETVARDLPALLKRLDEMVGRR